MKNKKGFTLIELLAVLVVLAILALISIPITIRIINSTRENSYKRSIVSYAKALELAIANDSMTNSMNDYKDLTQYEVEDMYSGNRVQCDLGHSSIINGKLNLVGCMVVKEIKIYNPKNRISKNIYTYYNGTLTKDEIYDYRIGDTFTIHNDLYYVIKNSPEEDDYVVALKAEPLTTDEVNFYGENHVNRYNWYHLGEAYDINGYGGVELLSSESCGLLIAGDGSSQVTGGCINTYSGSDLEYVVNQYGNTFFESDELKEVNNYKIRLINIDDLKKLGYHATSQYETYFVLNNNVPGWVYNNNYYYWTMSFDYSSLFMVYNNGDIRDSDTVGGYGGRAVRPVINIYKSAID